jgi:hypothetical protein
MEYSAEDSYMEKECMNPVHHIVDDMSDGVDDPPLDDERADDNSGEPQVITWFTFFSHRAQREYYYEPISGTTTWIAPTTTSAEEDHDCVISRLPGSPLEALRDAVVQGTQQYEQRVLPVITKRSVALCLLLGNMVLLAALWSSFRSGTILSNLVGIEKTPDAPWFTSSPDHSAMEVTPINDSFDDSSPSIILEADDTLDTMEEVLEVADTPPLVTADLENDDDVVVEVVVDAPRSDLVSLLPSDENEDKTRNDDDHGSADTEVDDSRAENVLVEEQDVPDAALTSIFTEVVDDEDSRAVELVDIPSDVAAETVVVPPFVDPEDRMEDAASNPGEAATAVGDDTLLEKENEAPVDSITPPDSSLEEDIDVVELEVEDVPVAVVEVVLEETLHRIQKEGDLLVQRVALVANEAGYSIELEPNLTAGFTHSPLELLMQGVTA